MATTTNYGWSTPDNTGLVKNGALDIRTLGNSIDTTTKALNPSTTLGDIEYRSSTANTNTRLAIGTNGQVLTVSGGVPTWATPAAGGGGKVLQVIYGSTTTATSVNTTTYTDISLSASITPSATSSKILVIANVQFYLDINAQSKSMGTRLLRGATAVFTDDTGMSSGVTALGATAVGQYNRLPVVYLDSPSTTSSTTYKIQGKGNSASGSLNFQEGSAPSSIILMEIGA